MNKKKSNWALRIALLISVLGVLPLPARATLLDCQDLYVGRIWLERGIGFQAVVFLANPTDAGGSYWSYFTYWSVDERKSALATLEAAKLAGHRVHVTTDNVDGCGITAGGTYVKSLILSTNP
ncbi:MAG: hypothetical protein ABI769_13045 [Pseudomonadota bacterium]